MPLCLNDFSVGNIISDSAVFVDGRAVAATMYSTFKNPDVAGVLHRQGRRVGANLLSTAVVRTQKNGYQARSAQ
jgi:hypothetical protein